MNARAIDSRRGRTRVLYLEGSWDGTVGGSHLSLLHLAKGIREHGYDPIVVFRSDHGAMDRYAELGVPMYVIPVRKPIRAPTAWLATLVRVANFVGYKISNLRCVWRFWRLLGKERIDVVHLNNSVGLGIECLVAARFRGLPVITHQRGYLSRYPIAVRIAASSLRAAICVSEDVRRNIVAMGFPAARAVTVHNGLDVEAFLSSQAPVNVREEFGIAPDCPIIGIVGNVQRWKGQDVVIRSVLKLRDRFPNLICLIVGDVAREFPWDVEYWDSLGRLIRENALEPNVVLTGYRRNVGAYQSAMDVVVHASVEPEAFGRVIVEAMAMRKPVVAARCGGVPEIVVDGVTGYLYPPGDSEELASRLEALLVDRHRRETMGAAGFERVSSTFQSKFTTQRVAGIYRAILAGQEIQQRTGR